MNTKESTLDQLLNELRKVASDRRWAFFIRDTSKPKDVMVCIHPYPTSTQTGDPEYHYLKHNPQTGLYSRGEQVQKRPVFISA